MVYKVNSVRRQVAEIPAEQIDLEISLVRGYGKPDLERALLENVMQYNIKSYSIRQETVSKQILSLCSKADAFRVLRIFAFMNAPMIEDVVAYAGRKSQTSLDGSVVKAEIGHEPEQRSSTVYINVIKKPARARKQPKPSKG